jgi:hypothetical protein
VIAPMTSVSGEADFALLMATQAKLNEAASAVEKHPAPRRK